MASNQISVITNAKVTWYEADHKLRRVAFKKEGDNKEYFIKPDLIINESDEYQNPIDIYTFLASEDKDV